MSEFMQAIVFLSIFRIIAIIIGLTIVYLGYLLFSEGMYERVEELKDALGSKYPYLAIPGAFFVLFGALVIGISIWQGVKIKEIQEIVTKANDRESLEFISIKKVSMEKLASILEKVIAHEQINEEELYVLRSGMEEIKGNLEQILKRTDSMFKVISILEKVVGQQQINKGEQKLLGDWLLEMKSESKVD